MKKSPSPYLNHIIDAATQIAEYVTGIDESRFRRQPMVQDAVIRRLEIIGEACSHLEDNFRSSHPHIPWKQIVAMRNKLAHEYWDVDPDIIWQAATVEVPRLKKELLDLLSQVGKK